MTTTAPAWIGWLEVDLCPYVTSTSVSAASGRTDQPALSDRSGAGEVGQSTQRTWHGTLGPVLVTMDVSVRMDIVLFWIGSRTVAVADRDRLAEWLKIPEKPLVVDDLELLVLDRQLCMRIDNGGPLVLSTASVSSLARFL